MPKHFRYMLIALLVVILIALMVFTVNYIQQRQPKQEESENNMPAIKVSLINGCGYEGLAAEFSEYLADKNIEIVSLGNTPKPIYDKTIIVIRKGDEEDLKRLQKMTGIKRFTYAKSEYAQGDFDIIIGKDYEDYTKQ